MEIYDKRIIVKDSEPLEFNQKNGIFGLENDQKYQFFTLENDHV